MAHVTALAESLSDLSNHLNVWILILNPKNLPRLEAYLSKYVDNLSIKDSSTLELLQSNIYRNGIDSMLWWGWPPGQWLGPLAFPDLNQVCVSFKYDYPSVPGFDAHFICYGDKYSNFIAGNHADLYPFRLGLIPDELSCLPKILFLRLNNLEIKSFSVVLEERKDCPTSFSRISIADSIQEYFIYILLDWPIKASRCCRFLQIQGTAKSKYFCRLPI